MKKITLFKYHLLHIIIIIMSMICLFLLEQLIKSPISFAGSLDMEMNATPNPIGSGARAMGIGGAFIGVADDATAASWNPAGLLQLTRPEISVVGSRFSGKILYQTSNISGEGDIDDCTPYSRHLNYLSTVIPFMLFRRNMVFSLNYQHLYEFSKDEIYSWTIENSELSINIPEKAHKQQRGSLNTISPALAFQVTPSFFIGLTANFWPNNMIDNGWENLNKIDGEGIALGRRIKTHTELYERYEFSGFNMHLGFLYKSGYHFLWGGRRQFHFGGVIKTPFKANIRHEQREISFTEYPENPVMNNYAETPSGQDRENLVLRMPTSYGLGFSLDFSDSFSAALDLYRTHWEKYLIRYPSNKEYSPINRKPSDEANIKSTTQIRMGIEYLIRNPKRIIPIRAGIFYDPEPASDRPDDFYGLSFGTGISYKELFSLDLAYQFRLGKKGETESMQGETISGRITQHYFYTSVIYYLF